MAALAEFLAAAQVDPEDAAEFAALLVGPPHKVKSVAKLLALHEIGELGGVLLQVAMDKGDTALVVKHLAKLCETGGGAAEKPVARRQPLVLVGGKPQSDRDMRSNPLHRVLDAACVSAGLQVRRPRLSCRPLALT